MVKDLLETVQKMCGPSVEFEEMSAALQPLVTKMKPKDAEDIDVLRNTLSEQLGKLLETHKNSYLG